MNLNITGDPGTHNSYSEVNIHIDHVENFNPAATTVVNNYGGESRDKQPSSQRTSATTQPTPAALEVLNAEILAYAGKLTKHVATAYVTSYEQLWRDILAMEEVAAEVYNPGKQQGTTFNRKLVAAIIGMMKTSGLFGDITDTRLTELLEGDKDHSVRAALADQPSSRVIYNNVRARIEALTNPAK